MVVEINHDGFARVSLMRDKVLRYEACGWCGIPARWFYWIQPDDRVTSARPRNHMNKAFCNIDCYRTYHA